MRSSKQSPEIDVTPVQSPADLKAFINLPVGQSIVTTPIGVPSVTPRSQKAT